MKILNTDSPRQPPISQEDLSRRQFPTIANKIPPLSLEEPAKKIQYEPKDSLEATETSVHCLFLSTFTESHMYD